MPKPVKSRPKKSFLGLASIKIAGGFKSVLLSALPYGLTLLVSGLIFGGIIVYVMNSSVFSLKEVVVMNAGPMTKEQAFEFCDLRPGENLITLDLTAVQQVVRRNHPEFKEVRVSRVLPNRIEVVLKRRTPAAQIMIGNRYVQVDRDLVLLPGSSPSAFKNLIIIEGVSAPRNGLGVGYTITDTQTKKALRLAEIIRQSLMLKSHVLTKIDIRDPKNISVFVDGDIEIKMGSTHLIERLKILEQTLRSIEFDRSKVQYVDLRFDDVVIGPR